MYAGAFATIVLMEYEERGAAQAMPRQRGSRERWPRLTVIIGTSLIILAGLGGGVWAIWNAHRQPETLLPAALLQQAHGFTPYFYAGQIPAEYTLDTSKATIDQGVLIMPLTSAGKPSIVLTEQSAPSSVSQQDLQQNGDKVDGTIAPATINDIEGRLLGTMIVADKQGHTLILLNALGNANKADLTDLLQGLRPTKR